MERDAARWIGAGAVLAVLWVGVYWAYEPGTGRGVEFAPAETHTEGAHGLPVGAPVGAPVAARTGAVRISPPSGDTLTPGPGGGGGGGGEPSEKPAVAPIRPPAGDPPKAPGKTIEPPAFFRYTVKPGDTFQTIAQKFFGSSGKWGVIAKANPLLDPKRLRAGVEVLIPKDETNIQGREIETAGGSAGPGGGTRGGPSAGGGSAGDWSEYVVESGDSLSRVSQKVYGTTRHADAIFEANRATLSSPDRVKVGQRLRIPPKPAG